MADDRLYIRWGRIRDNLSKAEFDRLLATMPEIIRNDLQAYKRWTDARASLTGKLILRQLLSALQLPYSLEAIRLEYKDRPVISQAFDFNISHSGDVVVVALARGRRIGIDVERHRPLDRNLFRKYFSDSEWAQIDTTDPLPAFFRLWSVKEAAIKCDGRGVEILGKTNVRDGQTVRCDDTQFHYRELQIGDGYSGAVCSTEPIGMIDLEMTDPYKP